MGYMDWFNTNKTDALDEASLEDSMNTAGQSYGSNLYNGSSNIAPASSFNMGSIGSVGSTLNSYTAPLGLAMSAYNTFFGQGKKSFDKNMKIADQTIASNQDKLDRRAALNKAWATTESNKNAGLAASAVV